MYDGCACANLAGCVSLLGGTHAFCAWDWRWPNGPRSVLPLLGLKPPAVVAPSCCMSWGQAPDLARMFLVGYRWAPSTQHGSTRLRGKVLEPLLYEVHQWHSEVCRQGGQPPGLLLHFGPWDAELTSLPAGKNLKMMTRAEQKALCSTAWKQLLLPCLSENVTQGGNDA